MTGIKGFFAFIGVIAFCIFTGCEDFFAFTAIIGFSAFQGVDGLFFVVLVSSPIS